MFAFSTLLCFPNLYGPHEFLNGAINKSSRSEGKVVFAAQGDTLTSDGKAGAWPGISPKWRRHGEHLWALPCLVLKYSIQAQWTHTLRHTHTHTPSHTNTHVYSHTPHTHTYTHTSSHTLIHTFSHTLIHAHTLTHIHTLSFSVSHTHSHTHLCLQHPCSCVQSLRRAWEGRKEVPGAVKMVLNDGREHLAPSSPPAEKVEATAIQSLEERAGARTPVETPGMPPGDPSSVPTTPACTCAPLSQPHLCPRLQPQRPPPWPLSSSLSPPAPAPVPLRKPCPLNCPPLGPEPHRRLSSELSSSERPSWMIQRKQPASRVCRCNLLFPRTSAHVLDSWFVSFLYFEIAPHSLAPGGHRSYCWWPRWVLTSHLCWGMNFSSRTYQPWDQGSPPWKFSSHSPPGAQSPALSKQEEAVLPSGGPHPGPERCFLPFSFWFYIEAG